VPIDNVQRWCEHISGVDLTKKYAPFWAVLPGVSFEYDSVRADFTRTLNAGMMRTFEDRAPRMAWQEGKDLHIESLATLMNVSADSIVNGWRAGVERGRTGRTVDGSDECLFGTAASLYDHVVIHTGITRPDGLGPMRDSIVTIPTGRKRAL
jgi:hypothetical protein